MISAWRQQRCRVESLYQRVLDSHQRELCQRDELKSAAGRFWLRFELALWMMSAAGAIWMSRRHWQDRHERRNLLAGILASVWIMRRWGGLFRRVARRVLPEPRSLAADRHLADQRRT